MLNKTAELKANAYPVMLADAFKKTTGESYSWLKNQPHAEVLYLKYTDVINNPLESAEEINAFFGLELDLQAMSAVVDVTLYRNKIDVQSLKPVLNN